MGKGLRILLRGEDKRVLIFIDHWVIIFWSEEQHVNVAVAVEEG